MKVILEAEFDIDSGIMKVRSIENPWQDLAYFLEAVSFLAKMNIGHDKRVETPEKMAEYIKQYLLKAIVDYKDETNKKEPPIV